MKLGSAQWANYPGGSFITSIFINYVRLTRSSVSESAVWMVI